MSTNFLELSLDERKAYVSKLIKSNPKSIPVILTIDKKSTILSLDKKR